MLAFEYGAGGSTVATYVLLTKVTAAGVKTLQSNPRRIKKDETIARVSVGLGARGTVQIETLTAIPIETFIRTIGKKTK